MIIPLTQGKVAIVSRIDYTHLSKFKWAVNCNGGRWYAVRSGRIHMHREILGFPAEVDHKNHDTLDNRRCNLRACTSAQNNWNRRKITAIATSSRYKGVCFEKTRGKWKAVIQGRCIGHFECEHQAALAYNERAKLLFKQFACLNEVT